MKSLRLKVPIDCDLVPSQLEAAVLELSRHGDMPRRLVVHPYAKHQAQSMIYHSGYRQIAVEIDAQQQDEDAWCLEGERYEVYSPGA